MENEEIKNQEVAVNETEKVNVKDNKATVKSTKVKKNTKKQSKDKGPSKMSKTVSELKKVSWPSFKEVVKQTSVVLLVVLIFMLVILALDKPCSLFIKWLCGK